MITQEELTEILGQYNLIIGNYSHIISFGKLTQEEMNKLKYGFIADNLVTDPSKPNHYAPAAVVARALVDCFKDLVPEASSNQLLTNHLGFVSAETIRSNLSEIAESIRDGKIVGDEAKQLAEVGIEELRDALQTSALSSSEHHACSSGLIELEVIDNTCNKVKIQVSTEFYNSEKFQTFLRNLELLEGPLHTATRLVAKYQELYPDWLYEKTGARDESGKLKKTPEYESYSESKRLLLDTEIEGHKIAEFASEFGMEIFMDPEICTVLGNGYNVSGFGNAFTDIPG